MEKEKIEVCQWCFGAVVRLYKGMLEAVLEETCTHCGRVFKLVVGENKDGNDPPVE